METIKIIGKKYFKEYMSLIGNEIPILIKKFDFNNINLDLEYQTEASAVYSSNIEGNTIDLNSFMYFKFSKEKFKMAKKFRRLRI